MEADFLSQLSEQASHTQSEHMPLSKKHYAPDLTGFISLCELNYAKLVRFLPTLEEGDLRCIGLSHNEKIVGVVRITVIERCRYTTMLSLEQSSEIMFFPPISMQVRLYHDASMAEVMSYQGIEKIRERYHYSDDSRCQKDEKELCNAFLSDWLNYCSTFGHRFDEVDTKFS